MNCYNPNLILMLVLFGGLVLFLMLILLLVMPTDTPPTKRYPYYLGPRDTLRQPTAPRAGREDTIPVSGGRRAENGPVGHFYPDPLPKEPTDEGDPNPCEERGYGNE